MVPNPLEKEPQGRGIFFRTLQCVDSLKFFSFKFPFNTDSNQHFSRENAQARRDKTFHARDLAVPRVNRRSCILAKKKMRGARNSQNAPPSTTILVCVI